MLWTADMTLGTCFLDFDGNCQMLIGVGNLPRVLSLSTSDSCATTWIGNTFVVGYKVQGLFETPHGFRNREWIMRLLNATQQVFQMVERHG